MGNSISQIKINSDKINWKNNEGVLTLNDEPSIIMWNKTLEILIKTLDEVAGIEKSNEVLKIFGYRLAYLVSQSYAGRSDLENILIEFSDFYRNAGWGNVKITMFSKLEKRIVIELYNSWEDHVFKSINKEQKLIILPSFWVGFMSALIKENMSYSISENTKNGIEFNELQIFMKE